MKVAIVLKPFIKALTVGLVALCWPLVAHAGGDAGKGERAFKKCYSCHNVDHPRTRMGPHLMGVVGRKIGAVEDYKYSAALQEANANGDIWTQEKLAAFIASPSKTLPGNAMRFFGLWSEAEIADIIAYLKTKPLE